MVLPRLKHYFPFTVDDNIVNYKIPDQTQEPGAHSGLSASMTDGMLVVGKSKLPHSGMLRMKHC